MKGGAVNIKLAHADLRLQARELLRVNDAAGTRVHCVRGSVWITQDGDQKDYHLGPGMAFVLDRRGLALVHALKPSEIVLSAPVHLEEQKPLWTTIANRLRSAAG
jgi:hypothetical protein